MFNINDIMGSITEFMSGGVAETDIASQITENFSGIDQITEPITNLTENLPDIPGVDIFESNK